MEKLSQELNLWQLHCWAARDNEMKAEQMLKVVQHELDTMHTLADDHSNLKCQYDTLTIKHKTDTDRLEQVIQETDTLEKNVLKLREQLRALEGVDFERQQLATKVKADKAEIAEKSKKENHKLAGNQYTYNRRCGKPTTVLSGDQVLLKNSRSGIAYRRSSSVVKPCTPHEEPQQPDATGEVAVTDTERMCANTPTLPRSVSTPPRARQARETSACKIQRLCDKIGYTFVTEVSLASSKKGLKVL